MTWVFGEFGFGEMGFGETGFGEMDIFRLALWGSGFGLQVVDVRVGTGE